MISFIVIGKNEGWRLSLCFESIINSTKVNNLKNYEILYVDSKSTDNSIDVAKQYIGIKIFSITGVCNAAIARNIGGKEASGEILIFLDGDMELQPDFLLSLFKENGKLVYPFLTGIVCHHYYSSDWVFLNRKLQNNINIDEYIETTGGFFIINRELWLSIRGMDTKFTKSQDLDFSLRLSKKGIKPLQIAKKAVIHHTISYFAPNRIWKMALSANFLALLTRKHLFNNKHFLHMFIRSNYTSIFLFLSCILFFLVPSLMIFYMLLIICRSVKRGKIDFMRTLLYYWIRDIIYIFSVFFYFPSSPKMTYKSINTTLKRT